MKARLLFSAILLGSFLCYSQQTPTNPSVGGEAPALATIPPITRIIKNVNEVNLVLTVKKGKHLVDSLKPEDLSILDNGEPPEQVTNFRTDTNLPLRLALVLDKSDSVRQRFKFEQKYANEFLRRVMRPGDQALVVAFNEKLELAQGATGDRRLLSQGIRRIKTGGNTALYDAVAFAAHKLSAMKEADPVRRVMIVLSDGEENSSHIGRERMIDDALHAETAIFTVTSTDEVICGGDPRCEQGDNTLKAMSESTGGEFFRAAREEDLDFVFRRIGDELRKQYAVSYRPRFALPDGVFHAVTVVAHKGMQVQCRKGYYATAKDVDSHRLD